jgi:ligand-binding sensor domain-containing protein/serine phosphatase RsbU (regulator of sigma subunit)
MRIIFSLPIRLLIYLLPIGSFAQQYSFIHYGVEEGLSQSVVNTILQDDDGYLWIGTMSGLNRFDGKEFILFDQQDSLAENWISASFKDSKGNLWFGHWAGGLSKYDANRKDFIDLEFAVYSDFKTITAIEEDEEGNLYIGTDGNGLLYLNTKTDEIFTYNKSGRLSSNYVLDLEFDERNRLWIATDRGITIKEENEQNSFTILTKKEGLKSTLINSLEKVGNDQMMIGYYNDGFSVVTYGDGGYNFSDYLIANASESSNQIRDILYSGEEEVWLGSAEQGLVQFNLKSDSRKRLSIEEGLNYYSVNTIFVDREENLWIGTDLGLNLFTGEAFQLYDENHGLSDNIVWAVDAAQGEVWVGTNAGLNHFQQGSFTAVKALNDQVIIAVFIDEEGHIWGGTPGDGLYKYNPATNRLTTFTEENLLPDNTVYSIAQDKAGYLWIGTKGGVLKYHDKKDEKQLYTVKDGLGGNNIYRIYIDSRQRIWMATLGGRLTLYQDGKFTTFGEEHGIHERFIITIEEGREGHIWFGAYGGVIYQYDGEDFKQYSNTAENAVNTPYSIISDESNRLWVGNSKGIALFDPTEGSFKEFGRREGFMGVEANSNAATLDREGNIWIGTIMGLVKFNPDKVQENREEPLTHITGLELRHEKVDFPDSAVFEYEDNNFTFEFAGLSMKNPDKVQYKYRLKGLEEEYSPPTSLNRAVYSNLPPGKYELQVLASNNDGLWNEEPVTYAFRIDPPYYMTTWFYLLIALIVLLLFWIIMRWRTANLKKAKAKLEAVVEERTLQLRDRNDELAQKNKDITDSIRYAKRIQNAILPSNEVFKSYLPKSFVYFRPKDIVSGDFYWIDSIGGKVIVTAVDCTGHGVPGAFMSLVGYNGLNKIVSEKKNTDPGVILEKLDKNVALALKQTEREGVKDGMDMAVCTIDPKARSLQYAGANNPLYIVSGDEVRDIRATKHAIGSYQKEGEVEYVTNEVTYKSGDKFYIFSDGFADQFGGKQGKKFKSGAFKKLLLDIKELPMEAQKENLGMTIMKWKGELEQVDDIVVIGFQLD